MTVDLDRTLRITLTGPITVVNNNSYRMAPSGEGGYQGEIFMSNTPNNNNMNFWNMYCNYNYWSQQECGTGWQGCQWTGSTQSGTGYPISGFRIGHHDGNSVRASNNGTNTIISVFGVAGSKQKNGLVLGNLTEILLQ